MTSLHCYNEKNVAIPVTPGEPASGFDELGLYRFRALPEHRLYIDDALLHEQLHEGEVVWLWEPGFFAGEVSAELTNLSGSIIAQYRLDVAPSSDKLGKDIFAKMLEDIVAFDAKLLFGTESAQISIGMDGEDSNPHLQYARLRRYGESLVAALRQVTERPLTRLRRERVAVGAHQVRRLEPSAVRAALKSRTIILGSEGVTLPSSQASFEVAAVFEHQDNPANQVLGAILQKVMSRCRQTIRAFERIAETERRSDTRSELAPRLKRRIAFLDGLYRALRRQQRMEPFCHLSTQRITAAGLNAISAHPIYARAYRFGWHSLRPGVLGTTGEESLWISPSWEIYERWCYIKIVEQLRSLHPILKWEGRYPTQREDCICWRGKGPEFTLEVWLQIRCPAIDRAPYEGFSSLSKQRFPDIAVTLEAGGQRKFVILDAKYRTSRHGVLDGMASAHIYHDSLRWYGQRPSCALLLVPRAGEVEKLQSEDFWQEQGVGLAALGSDDDVDAIIRLLSRLLIDA
ncbi:nuclease domain-containing protein [Pseudomonas aeruginosa]|uniref:nuclease domain-containing protein n=1 Tax=Pseudomonas aeruginosa TaxID=287 RepID=UPI00068EE5AE|nr:nuclease domain-containing protein [Pseudomonas aeruginosa]